MELRGGNISCVHKIAVINEHFLYFSAAYFERTPNDGRALPLVLCRTLQPETQFTISGENNGFHNKLKNWNHSVSDLFCAAQPPENICIPLFLPTI
jgi:hypothetical protein